MSGEPRPDAALAGVRVLDLADRSAALAGRILADLGAEVILVEPPAGNPIRRMSPMLDSGPEHERSVHHQYYGANKTSVVLDLDDPDDRGRFRALVRTADVVIDTERPGRLDELDLGQDQLRTIRPDLIHASVTPFGLDGPWRHWSATDLIAGAAGGLVWVSGESRSTPVHGGANPSYSMAGLTAASAIMIALTRRFRSPDDAGADGVHLDISMQEATVMAVLQTATPTIWTWFDRVPRRPGLSNALQCADGGYVGLLVRPDRFEEFLAWCDAVGVDHSMTLDDWEWALVGAPRAGNPVAEATLALAAKLTRDEFAAGALEADLVCLPVLGFDDLATHEQYRVNHQFSTVHHPGLGRDLGFVRSPVDAMTGGVTITPAPLLGQHQHLVATLTPTPAPSNPPATAPTTATPPTAHSPAGPAAGFGGAATPSPSPTPDPGRALAGIRVVDLTWVLAGPLGTRLLASFGAEVIRIESTAKPDSMRSQPGPDGRPDPELGGLFNTVNAGKKSLAVDLGTDDGLALVEDLVATADVVVNNFRPGALDRMGLGYDVLRALRPDIVLLNLPGAHRHGPWAQRSSMGNILMAASGLNLLTGFDGQRPRGMGIAYPDFTSPHLLVTTLLAALRHRQRTGEGQELHLPQLSGLVSLLGAEWMHYAATGVQPPRPDNRSPDHCPHGVYPAAPSDRSEDEWVAIAVGDDGEWRALCHGMDQPGLVDDPRFATHDARKENEDELDRLVGDWTVGWDKWDLAERLQAHGVAAAPVEHLADTYERDPQLRHHYQIVRQPSAPGVDIPIDREPARWRGRDHVLRRAPATGEHNEEIVRGILGRTEEEYVALVLDGVLS